MPEFDRDRGSGRVDQFIRFLLDDGWAVTFLADEDHPDRRHARRLRQLGVATFAGYADAPAIIAHGGFDLALIAFWRQAAALTPILRRLSPTTRIIVDSIDLHFLREARRCFGLDGQLDASFGSDMAGELNAYRAADLVLTVSGKETSTLGDLIGDDRVHEVPLAEDAPFCDTPFAERQGMLFVGNFRHLPNGEAVEYLCKDVVPRIDPRLLATQPLTVVGNRLDDRIRRYATGLHNVNMVGWVPSVAPYIEQARAAVVPLLHGAGVKGKVVEAMMRGTPVATTPIGAEGLGLSDGHDAFIADDPQELADSITRLLLDGGTWERMRSNARESIASRYGIGDVSEAFAASVARALRPRVGASHSVGFRHGRRRLDAYRSTVEAVAQVIDSVTDPGAVVLVVSHGDEELVTLHGRVGWHFPRDDSGEWAGYHPADSAHAISALHALREAGASYLVLPSSAFWWLHHYTELAAYLDGHCRRIHADSEAIVFDVRPHTARSPEDGAGADVERPRVLLLGSYTPEQGPPSAMLVAEIDRSQRFQVVQRWEQVATGSRRLSDWITPAVVEEADWVIALDSDVDLPSGFLDEFITLQSDLGVDRAQPAHHAGPSAAAPVTERLKGAVARIVTGWTPVPFRSVRAGADLDGDVALIDATSIGLNRSIERATDAEVRQVYVAGPAAPVATVHRSPRAGEPAISVLVSTYRRPDLLAECLAGFVEQTLDAGRFEVVVVDDGSDDDETAAVIGAFNARLPLVSARLAHAGRSAAKNLAVMLARAPIVVFFDDDDRPAPDLLEQHLAAHEREPGEASAVLGYTSWAPELTVTPLMHFLTDVDKLLFAYGNLTDGQELDWRGFWEGRLSCKRELLMRRGLHDQRLVYSIDVELAYRLARHGLRVSYVAAARSVMARSIDFEQFCARIEAKGEAQAQIAFLHDNDVVRAYTKVDAARDVWESARMSLAADIRRIGTLEVADEPDVAELHRLYRQVFAALYARGVLSVLDGGAPDVAPIPEVCATAPLPEPRADRAHRSQRPVLVTKARAADRPTNPVLSVTIPVWSRTPELAEMAERTVARLHEVASMPTEIIVIDNASPHPSDLRADVYQFPINEGVSVAWNAGIALARADVVAVLNSDCMVEPGWDVALHEAVRDGRRIAFPYTDHDDGEGFRRPDQAGTAGWCFMLTRDLFDEIGQFDERFSPAFGEDTDYWHRAWELGVELSPVPAARVRHARRTTGKTDPYVDWLLLAHRYKYGWKHGVDPLRAPPYYNRTVTEYVGKAG